MRPVLGVVLTGLLVAACAGATSRTSATDAAGATGGTGPASGAASPAATVPASPADEAAIRAELDSTAAGWNRGDLDGYLSAYADSITSRSSDGFATGKAAAADVMRQGFWRTGRPLQQLRYEHLVVRALGPDYALVTGQYVLSGADRPDRTGWFTTVWARTPAGWRMIHDHS
jgi:ketosteroid isomerase-like protein